LQIKYYDDESEATRSAELAGALVDQDGIKFILAEPPTTAFMAPVSRS
jgi:ABC-type branched-subunit amino acid transport system substrate-binding protein